MLGQSRLAEAQFGRAGAQSERAGAQSECAGAQSDCAGAHSGLDLTAPFTSRAGPRPKFFLYTADRGHLFFLHVAVAGPSFFYIRMVQGQSFFYIRLNFVFALPPPAVRPGQVFFYIRLVKGLFFFIYGRRPTFVHTTSVGIRPGPTFESSLLIYDVFFIYGFFYIRFFYIRFF